MTLCIITPDTYKPHLYTAGTCIATDIKVLQVPTAQEFQYDVQSTATYLLPYVALCSYVITGGDAFWNAVLSYMAMSLNAPMVSGVTAITESGWHRRTYGGAVISTVETQGDIAQGDIICASINVHSFDAYVGNIPTICLDIPDTVGKNTLNIVPVFRSKTLATAKKVIVVGGAVTNAQDVDTIGTIAHYIGADIGATTPVISAGLLPPHTLVGSSGTHISPDIYIGIGVSGAAHHICGIQRAKKNYRHQCGCECPLV